MPNTGILHVQSSDVDYRLAAGFYERGQWDEASQAFSEFIERYPYTAQAPQASFFLAETMMQRHQFKAAYVRYQQFLKQFAAHPLSVRAMFRMGESAFRDDNTAIAVRMLEEFTRKYPTRKIRTPTRSTRVRAVVANVPQWANGCRISTRRWQRLDEAGLPRPSPETFRVLC